MPASFLFSPAFLQREATEMLAWLHGQAPWTLHLITEDHDWLDGEDESDVTEATFDGYAPVALDMANWGGPSTDGFLVVSTYAPPVVFTLDIGAGEEVTVYGYFLLDSLGGFQFGEITEMTQTLAPGEGVQVTPRYKRRTCREE